MLMTSPTIEFVRAKTILEKCSKAYHQSSAVEESTIWIFCRCLLKLPAQSDWYANNFLFSHRRQRGRTNLWYNEFSFSNLLLLFFFGSGFFFYLHKYATLSKRSITAIQLYHLLFSSNSIRAGQDHYHFSAILTLYISKLKVTMASFIPLFW